MVYTEEIAHVDLYRAQAGIHHIRHPWSEVEVSNDVIRCTNQKHPNSPLWHPVDRGFWRKVKQLYFAFIGDNTTEIIRFYRKYGPICSSAWMRSSGHLVYDHTWRPTRVNEEKRKVVHEGLHWFQTLTSIVEWTKKGRSAALREHFEKHWEHVESTIASVTDAAALLEGNYLPPDVFPYAWPPIKYLLYPVVDHQTGEIVAFRIPESDDELYHAAWSTVQLALFEYTSHVTVTVAVGSASASVSPLSVCFSATSGLEAAVLQWFLQEVATLGVTECQADDCINPVIPPRRIYCSERCRLRQKQRRYRERKRMEDTWSEPGEPNRVRKKRA